MLKIFLLCGLFFYNISICYCDAMIGPGKWNMLKMEKTTGNFDEVEFNLSQRKLNRTHDCFQGSFVFHEELGAQFGAKIDVCKYVDGGCKQYQVLSDESFPGMVATYCEENMMSMLRMAGVDEPGWPVPPGEYKIKDYMFNYDELPAEGPYGEFEAKACCMKGTVEVGCITMQLEFKEEESSDEDE